MDPISLVGISMGLAMDCFAIAIAIGADMKKIEVSHALRVALFFGGFQAIMPVIGWLGGVTLTSFLSGFAHWVVFGLLVFIGVKMIYESTKLEEGPNDSMSVTVLLVLAIATSIDALAIGLSFAFMGVAITIPILVMGAFAFVLSFAGVYIGERFGHIFENRMEIVGGVILIGMGIKVLSEHLMF